MTGHTPAPHLIAVHDVEPSDRVREGVGDVQGGHELPPAHGALARDDRRSALRSAGRAPSSTGRQRKVVAAEDRAEGSGGGKRTGREQGGVFC